MSSKILKLNLGHKVIEIRPYSEVTIKDMAELAKLDSTSEFYEITKASMLLKACLVDKSDWEYFENMTAIEFGEIISDWTDLHNSDLDLNG